MNTTPFRTNCEIKDPNRLFGRKEELQKLCDYAEGLQQVEIVGARRFGKTSLIRSFITIYKGKGSRRAYPIYLDIHSDSIKGTANVYRYLSAQVISNLYADGAIGDNVISFDDINITPSKNWNKVYKQLGEVEEEIEQISIFDEIVEFFSEQIGQTLLLIFDEYEKAIDSFDKIDGLMHLRTKTNTTNYLSFWIIGATPWKKLILESNIDVRGSGVFNGITFDLYVKPLFWTDFKDMWTNECNLINEESKRQQLISLCEKIYESSGSVPCFAKIIGFTFLIEKNYPQYNCLIVQFAEIERNLTNEEIRSLRELLSSPKQYLDTDKKESITSLEDYGIIRMDDNYRYYIPSRFFSDYLRAKLQEEKSSTIDTIDFNKYVDGIAEKICRINDIWHDKFGIYMFDIENDTQRHFITLRKPCDNPDQFSSFINAIYLIYWEGAKENDIAGDKIPEYYKKTMFRLSMDRIRHVFGKAHEKYKLTTRYGQVNITTALSEITGYSTEPETPEEWLTFQECMLKRLLKELTDINKSITPDVQIGKSYTGVIVEVTKTDGRVFKNVRSEISHRFLRIKNSDMSNLHDGDNVTFIAKQENDPNDPLMTYWVAYNVHLD